MSKCKLEWHTDADKNKDYIQSWVLNTYGFRPGELTKGFFGWPNENSVLAPKKVIYNGPATIVFWNDGTKTVVKCSECKEKCFASNMNCPYFDREKGLAFAFVKRTYDNHSRYYEMFKKNCKEEWEK